MGHIGRSANVTISRRVVFDVTSSSGRTVHMRFAAAATLMVLILIACSRQEGNQVGTWPTEDGAQPAMRSSRSKMPPKTRKPCFLLRMKSSKSRIEKKLSHSYPYRASLSSIIPSPSFVAWQGRTVNWGKCSRDPRGEGRRWGECVG